jgi:eukaryotic-like serine/threonine-protein kinase
MPRPPAVAELDTPRPLSASGAARARARVAPIVAGYEIGRMLGKGGMGVVWEAFEHRLERKVALKVHSGGATPERVAQLWAEAKLAARIAHAGVVSVHDVGTTLDGEPYYTMDLIEGTSLSADLKRGPLSPSRALAIGIEIADAVAAAHACGIVHCDLKPSNILLDIQGRVKILDFGIAERLDQKRERTEILGTPPYMSPEQINAEAPSVSSDVYSIGVILYEMIAGQRPFAGDCLEALIFTILTEPPPPLSQVSPLVHTDLERVCMRCLEKRPAARFSSARALHEALVAILEGRPILDEAAPTLSYVPRAITVEPQRHKLSRESAPCHYRFSVDFNASPELLWSYITNTERVGKLLGWPALEFSSQRAPEGHLMRMATVQILWTRLSWEVNPYAWVRDREFIAFQGNERGPVQAVWYQFFLKPGAAGRTEVTVEFRAISQGIVGWLMAFIQFKLWFPRRFEKFFKRLAGVLDGADARLDAYEPPHRPSVAVRARVDKAAALLTRDRRFPETLVAELVYLLLYAPDKKIERLRPFALADAWGARRQEVLDLFLHAAHAGLVDVAWDMICAECRLPYETVPSLQKVVRAGTCTGCGSAYEGDLARSVELVFRPHVAVRRIRPQTYCVQAPSDRPHIVAQQILDPGERRTLVLELSRGAHRIVATRAARAWDFAVSAVGSTSASTLRLTPEGIEARPLVVLAGKVSIEIENATSREEIFRVEAAGEAGDRVTAAVALNHPSFQQFFSKELIAHGDHLSVSRMAFLFLDVVNRTELLREHGDAGTLQILSEVALLVREEVEAQQGSLATADSTVGLLIAPFPEGVQALRAALRVIGRSVTEASRAVVRASVHKGRCIALTREGQVQYFGETLDRGASLLEGCAPLGIVVSTEISSDRDVARVILEEDAERRVTVTVAARRGSVRRAALADDEGDALTAVQERAVLADPDQETRPDLG